MIGPPKVKILMVDDLPANLLALEAVLGAPNYDLVRAFSGAEAIKLVEEWSFATIILDLHMPGLDGYETARRIKKLPHGAEVPIIFITAVYKESEDVRRGYEAGAIDFIPKPFEPSVLKAKVSIYT